MTNYFVSLLLQISIIFIFMMNWQQLLSAKRFGMEEYHDEKEHNRSDFQRDYDRLIFSSPFRRLQNKTQVFPLPGSVFVHNRLTHSIEVSTVGRSLGDMVGQMLKKKYSTSSIDFEYISSIVAAACLAHDLGNPPFGHSGETAITSYFTEGKGIKKRVIVKENGIEKEITLKEAVERDNGRWIDFERFEGNANSIRLLMHQFKGRRKGGFAMTYSMLASIVKYPYASTAPENNDKFGFFQSEEESYKTVADALGIIRKSTDPLIYVRYPLVYLVEAADDICYKIMDIEDAHKLGLLSKEKTMELFLNFFSVDKQARMQYVLQKVSDTNEQIAYLRASVIGLLVDECAKVFYNNEESILKGEFQGALIKHINELPRQAYKDATKISIEQIYKSRDVVDIELAGHRIIGFLLDTFVDAILTPDANYSKLIINRVPTQYEVNAPDLYTRILAVIDFISGMTDVYALDLYQKITGLSLPTV